MEMLTRARGALYGLAIGDALGMPTQMLSRAEIVRRWGPLLPGFEPAPPGHPIAGGMPAGTVTDDTEQAVLLARLLVKGRGTIDPHELAAALTEWERAMAERGSLDLLGPSTKRAVAAILAGVPPEEAGAAGTTNGAAMRIAPVGIAVPVARITPLPKHCRPWSTTLVMASSVTHNTGVALAGAAAVAARGERGCLRRHDRRGHGAGHPGRAPRGRAAVTGWRARTSRPASSGPPASSAARRRGRWRERSRGAHLHPGRHQPGHPGVGTGRVRCAGRGARRPWRACRMAASLGGDSDTIAAMTGAIAGACHGAGSFPPEAIAAIDAQGLGLAALAANCSPCAMRSGSEAPCASQPVLNRLVFAGEASSTC